MHRTAPEHQPPRAAGFTLVEMVVAMTLLSVLALAAVPMLRLPMTAYMDVQRRADAAQTLDAVHAKLTSDLAGALPGSVRARQAGARWFVEYLEVRASGRHRAGLSGAPQACPATCSVPANNDSLEAACTERCFTALGALAGGTPAPGTDWVVVNPQGVGVPGGDPWVGGNVAVAGGIKTRLAATAAAADGLRLTIQPHSFPALAATRRFWIVSQPVSWECNPTTGRLTRHWGYPIAAVQPVAFGGGNSAPMADGIAACSFRVTQAGGEGRSTVDVWLRQQRTEGATGSTEAQDLVASFGVGAS
jgi:MSHA biogenesis protein MshO